MAEMEQSSNVRYMLHEIQHDKICDPPIAG